MTRWRLIQRGSNMNLFAEFFRDESAATAIEYALIAVGISVAIVAVVQGVGTQVNTLFTNTSTALGTVTR
jgi:pilus assembly protein Flp/PilA